MTDKDAIDRDIRDKIASTRRVAGWRDEHVSRFGSPTTRSPQKTPRPQTSCRSIDAEHETLAAPARDRSQWPDVRAAHGRHRRPPSSRGHRLHHPGGDQRRASVERRGPGVAPLAVPDAQGVVPADLHRDRADHADAPADLLAGATAGRALHGPPIHAVLAGRRHGRDARRHPAPVVRHQPRHDPARRRIDGGGIGRLPPGVVARGAHGVGRTARAGPIALPGWRQFRLVARPAVGRVLRGSSRPAESRLVLAADARGHGRAVARRPLVQGAQAAGVRDRRSARRWSGRRCPRRGSGSRSLFWAR